MGAGAFDGARTFGEQARHLATVIFLTAARILEEPSPHASGTDNNGPDHVRSKAEVVVYLNEALAYARRAMTRLTPDNMTETVPSSFGPQTRAWLAAGILYHSYNHYGQMAVYARMCGIVPPSSFPGRSARAE